VTTSTLQSQTIRDQTIHDLASRSLNTNNDPVKGRVAPRARFERFGIGPTGFVFALANAALIALAAVPLLKGEQGYRDLVSGSLAWSNADKGFDFRIFYTFAASFLLLLGLIASLTQRLRSKGVSTAALNLVLLVTLSPGALWLGGQLATNSFGDPPFECLGLSASALVLLFLLSRPSLAIDAEDLIATAKTSLFAIGFVFFDGLGVTTFLNRVCNVAITQSATVAIIVAICGATFVALLACILSTCAADKIRRRCSTALFATQLPLPLLLSVVIPPPLVQSAQRIPQHSGVLLMAALSLGAVASWGALARRWRIQRPVSFGDVSKSIVPLTVLPIAIFLAIRQTFPGFVGDDFHTGEHLLPWQQLRDFGKLPFVGFVPVHPLMDYFVGSVNSLFFDGTLANYENSRVILFALGAGLTFLAIERFAGVGVALTVSFAATVWDRLLFTPALFVILCNRSVLAARERWLFCWCGACALAVCYNPAAGVALSLASAPVASFQLWKLFRESRRRFYRFGSACGLSIALLFLVPATRAVTWGFVRFLVDNGRTIIPAHGIEWRAATTRLMAVKGILGSPVVWEALRFSWIVVMLLAVWLLIDHVCKTRPLRIETVAATTIAALFLFFLSGWTLTRIDPAAPSRTGEVSYSLVCTCYQQCFAGRGLGETPGSRCSR
jgi:hypothetical protein